ncbi:hypothetical protein D5F01_LYC25076 [Larimichthys crocea]|uniref:Uncharacterized protein n=1 Tax=Larimichthys crocea TaxID=215358 RepID=A0A6G0HD13_LARCR|nr:hypothetical protein D5F01_LYC25076 [Larimichthys crocea]
MAHVPPSSLHTSLGKPGLHRASLLLEVRGPDHTHTTHARTHKHTQRNQEEGPDMAHVPPSSCTHPWATWAPQSLSPPGGQRGLIILTLHTHARTSITEEPGGGPEAHVPPSSLHTSRANLLHRASLLLEVRGAAASYSHSHAPANLGSTEPLSSWRSEGLIILTLHTHAHKHTQRNQEEGPDMAHVPPSSLHTSLGKLGSTEPLSSWRSGGLIILTLHTHAHTHKHTQRNQEEGPDMAHVPPSSLHIPGQTWAPQSLSPPGGQRGLIILTLHTHARTSIHRGTRRRALTWLTSHPAACTHPWADLGSTEPLSSWRSEGPDHTHTTHARTHKHTQRNQEEGPDMAHVPPSSLHTSWANWAPQSLSPPGGQRGLIILTLHTHTRKPGLHRASLLLEVRGA